MDAEYISISDLFKGVWNGETAYTIGDIVINEGSSYVAISNGTNHEPPNTTYWALLSSKGETGEQGDPGEEIQLQVSGGYIQWKYTSDVSWTNLIAVASLKGDKGDQGDPGVQGLPGEDGQEIELQKTATHIQWRYVGAVTWNNLVALTNITGPKGDTGDPGMPGGDGEDGTSIVWKGDWNSATAYAVNDVVFRLGSSYICISAHTNHEPPNATYWELIAQKGTDGEGSGDVMGPASSVTNRVAVFDGLTGKLLKDGGKTIAEIEAASVAKNNPITGATKTKITYDAKGLVTSGADATTADIADSANKRYVTDAEKTLLGNTSGVNTGDQTLPVKTTGAAINTGTNDTDFATPKAIADSYIGQRFYIPNYLINGNFDIVQRSSSLAFTNPATGSYTLDRYQIGISNSGTLPTSIIHARQPLTFGELPGSFYHYRINVNGAGSGFGANDLYNLSQKIEHGTRFLCGSGSKVTVSFFARSSISGKKIGLALRQSYGSGGSPSSEELINGTNWTLTSSWTKYKYTFTTNTLSGKTFGSDNNDFLQMEFGIMYGSTRAARFGDSATETFGGSGNIDIAKVKLEPGDVDTPFIPKSPDKELEACERYCQWIGDTTKLIQYGGSAATQDGGGNFRMYIPISLKTPMRIAPIATVFSDADTASKITVGDSGIYAGAPSNVDCNGTPVLNIGPDGGHVVVIHNAVFHVCKFYLRLEAEL